MSDNRQASNALLKGIEHIVKKELEKAPIDKTYTGIIKTVKENNLYDIIMQGQLYTNVPSIFKGLTVNSTVKVKIPQGQYSLMYIEGQFNIDIAGGQGFVTTVNGKTGDVIVKEDKEYVHTQLEGSKIWNIKHNLDKFPSVTVVDSGNNTVIGDVDYINKDEIRISFTYPFSGKAYLN